MKWIAWQAHISLYSSLPAVCLNWALGPHYSLLLPPLVQLEREGKQRAERK